MLSNSHVCVLQRNLHQYPLHRISFCADDKAEKRFFSFIAKEADSEEHTCYVFVSDKLVRYRNALKYQNNNYIICINQMIHYGFILEIEVSQFPRFAIQCYLTSSRFLMF